MENTVIQHSFLKSDQSKKKQILNNNPRTPDKIEKPPDLVKKNISGNNDSYMRQNASHSDVRLFLKTSKQIWKTSLKLWF